MTSKITPSCKPFTTSSACKSFYTSIAILPWTAGVIRTSFALVILLLLLMHVYVLEGSLRVIRRQHWHLSLQLGGWIIAHALRHVLLELSLSGGGNSGRTFSIQHIRNIHGWNSPGGSWAIAKTVLLVRLLRRSTVISPTRCLEAAAGSAPRPKDCTGRFGQESLERRLFQEILISSKHRRFNEEMANGSGRCLVSLCLVANPTEADACKLWSAILLFAYDTKLPIVNL